MAPRTRAAARAAAVAAMEEAGTQVFSIMMDRTRAPEARWRAACERARHEAAAAAAVVAELDARAGELVAAGAARAPRFATDSAARGRDSANC